MKIYAGTINLDFDPNKDERFATELDQFAGQDVWVRVQYSDYKRNKDVWIRPLQKTYNGNVFWEFNQIDTDYPYKGIPEFKYQTQRVYHNYYNRLHVVEPAELATTDDLMELCGLYLSDIKSEHILDSYIGKDQWVLVTANHTDNDGQQYYLGEYIRVLDKQNGNYIYNTSNDYIWDCDDCSLDYIYKMIEVPYIDKVSEFGVPDDPPKVVNTSKIIDVLKSRWGIE